MQLELRMVSPLILAGENHPNGPDWITPFTSRFPAATLVAIPGTAGSTLAHHYSRNLMRGFLAEPSRRLDAGCVGAMLPVQFKVP